MNHLTSDQDNNQPVKHNPDEIVTSWRDIDASTPEGLRELNAVIARRLGWKIEGRVLVAGTNWLKMIEPDGTKSRRLAFPLYTTDANAALALFTGIHDIRLIMDYVNFGEWRVGYQYAGMRYLPGSGSYYPLPEAICRAWLTWSDAQAAAAGGKREAGE